MTRAWCLLALAAWASACKPKEVPFKPPPKEDAGGGGIDAESEIDAPPAATELKADKVVVGDHTSCALMIDATLRCWGKNSEGQLGNGTTADSPTPVKVNLTGVKDIVLGTKHACALLDDASVTCWGRIYFGKKENLLSPTAVPGVAKARRLFAVGAASCATIEDNSLVCWGDIDVKGHLKLSGGSMNRVPTPSNGLDHIVALSANGALESDGTVWFWGGNGDPVKTAMTDVIEIASTGDEVCGLRRDGTVACAGPATRCAAAAPKSAAPKPKAAPKKTATKSATKKTATKTATKKTATKKPATKTATKAAPKTAKGKPVAKVTAKPAPKAEIRLIPIEVLRLPPAKHLAFDVGLCVVTKTGKLQCLASNACNVDTPWPGLANVDYVIGNCARLTDGAARCWSVDSKSRLVTAVAGVGGAISVAASSSHACAVLGDRSVVCWGSNKSGALGRSKADDQTHPEASAVTF
jgi:hypothetical protein